MSAILPVNGSLLVYSRRVFRSLKVSVPLILLAVLGLAMLPVLPRTETASAELHPAEVENAGTLLGESSGSGTLLGEGSQGLKPPPKAAQASGEGRGATLTLTVPKLGLKNVAVTTGSTQDELDQEGILHLAGTGVPWQEGSNTFIVGHALGYMWTRVTYAFYDLDKMQPGDEIIVKDPKGNEYDFQVYDRMTVRPTDYWVTYPEDGRTIISLQTCTPVPTFENRLVVRGELVS
jgi:sortase A